MSFPAHFSWLCTCSGISPAGVAPAELVAGGCQQHRRLWQVCPLPVVLYSSCSKDTGTVPPSWVAVVVFCTLHRQWLWQQACWCGTCRAGGCGATSSSGGGKCGPCCWCCAAARAAVTRLHEGCLGVTRCQHAATPALASALQRGRVWGWWLGTPLLAAASASAGGSAAGGAVQQTEQL